MNLLKDLILTLLATLSVIAELLGDLFLELLEIIGPLNSLLIAFALIFGFIIWGVDTYFESECKAFGEVMSLETQYVKFHCFVNDDGQVIPLGNYRFN